MKNLILSIAFASAMASATAADVASTQAQIPVHNAGESRNNYIILSAVSNSVAPNDVLGAETALANQVSLAIAGGYKPLGGLSLAIGGGRAYVSQAMAAPNGCVGKCR
ncbi:hypothetical protein [Burkholderia arboris]|uniref:hypothetical protein n=1 Tax=Burkholderia arboris TaxID=488730 RepID=UPI001CF2D1CA|nr:hypothetical protein [Burkholderia arboris]MCA8050694.1 hypothetical protein [Burkholderia arboris]